MTGPEDSHTGTRPISVAELLAKNGTIGAPPVGGRRRRRRGNSDSVTVAELTGEIPIVSDDDPAPETRSEPETRREPDPALVDTAIVAAVDAEPAPHSPRNGAATSTDVEREPEPEIDPVEADYDAHLQARDADPEPVEFRPRPRRQQYPGPRDYTPSGSGAERMSPDPLDDLDDHDAPTSKGSAKLVESADDDVDTDGDRESYLGSSLGPLFGGQSVADDIARKGRPGVDDDVDDDDRTTATAVDDRDDLDEFDEVDDTEGSPLVRGAWIVGQCVIAVAFGAGLFIAFDQLWKWNTIVALVLGVLVILGLAGGVRVVRKTEDIGSTLTAVAVGALVTFGPLALLQAS
ncbi:FUSC family protein [Mycobacterium sp. LTG2003]